jgi:hypothetical protein
MEQRRQRTCNHAATIRYGRTVGASHPQDTVFGHKYEGPDLLAVVEDEHAGTVHAAKIISVALSLCLYSWQLELARER